MGILRWNDFMLFARSRAIGAVLVRTAWRSFALALGGGFGGSTDGGRSAGCRRSLWRGIADEAGEGDAYLPGGVPIGQHRRFW